MLIAIFVFASGFTVMVLAHSKYIDLPNVVPRPGDHGMCRLVRLGRSPFPRHEHVLARQVVLSDRMVAARVRVIQCARALRFVVQCLCIRSRS
ncbi:hypothetical protein MRX96_000564 [Rhipicephalus microplus]